MRLLVTRPQEDAARLLAKLRALGHEAICSPVMGIVPRQNAVIPGRRYQAVALSSANAARAFAAMTERRDVLALPAFTVGQQSAEAARAAGFLQVEAAGGDVKQLAGSMISRLDPEAGVILYLSGQETAGELKGALEASGFRVERVVLYDAVPTETLTAEAAKALMAGHMHGVLLYSPRSARIWKELTAAPALAAKVRPLRHYCLSANVAAALGTDYLSLVAPRPEEDALLALLDRQG